MPPVVASPRIEAAVFNLNLLSATGTGILLAAILSEFLLGYGPLGLFRSYGRTLYLVRYSLPHHLLHDGHRLRDPLLGTDATLGLALAGTGWLYPLFGTLIGWLGVALTGSDTSSNVLFGGLQRVTAEQLGLNPVLMAAANSSGGVMGKMIDAQSIVVASTATKWYGHEGLDPALRLLPFRRTRDTRRSSGHGPSLRLAFDETRSVASRSQESVTKSKGLRWRRVGAAFYIREECIHGNPCRER